MQRDIQERIAAIRRGEVPQGYKRDKRGLYPQDWPIKKMKEWLHCCERPVTLEDKQEYTLVTVRRAFGGVDKRGVFWGKSILVKNYFQVKAGDFVISKRQISHGACGVVGSALDGAVVSNEYNAFVPKKHTDMQFFFLMMQLPYYRRLFYLMSDGVHIEKLLFKTKDWLKQTIALPSLAEQQKIVAILNTCDTLIALQERLIATKERQKKHLMQQLLTGKKRLLGFSGKWKKMTLAEFEKQKLIFLSRGKVISKKDIGNNPGTFPIYSSSVHKDGLFGCYDNFMFDEELITWSIDGGGNFFYRPKHKFSVTNVCGYMRVDTSCINYSYLAAQLQYLHGRKYFDYQSKAHPSVIRKEYKISLPPLPEQTAIAEILSAADKEIDLLKQTLEQEKRKKKALMQLLLTGVVRV